MTHRIVIKDGCWSHDCEALNKSVRIKLNHVCPHCEGSLDDEIKTNRSGFCSECTRLVMELQDGLCPRCNNDAQVATLGVEAADVSILVGFEKRACQ